jgi:hypothetical protein
LCRILGPRGEDYYRSVIVDFQEFAFHALGWIRARGRAKPLRQTLYSGTRND